MSVDDNLRLFTSTGHAPVTDFYVSTRRAWPFYQMASTTDKKAVMQMVIDTLGTGVPAALAELRKLGTTLKRRAANIVSYFELPRISNGPTKATNGRLEPLRGIALGFRYLTNYTFDCEELI